MTTITEGMTSAQFITALNVNFGLLAFPNSSLATITSSSDLTAINGNFIILKNETYLTTNIFALSNGMTGSDFINALNYNFNNLNLNINGANAVLTVGTDKNYKTINTAVARAISGNTLKIDAGTYNEHIDLSTKRLNLIGSGTLETIIYYTETLSPTNIFSTVSIGTNSTFDNIIFRKLNNNAANSHKEIISISACNPEFTNCEIQSAQSDHRLDIMLIQNSSNVTMTNCIFDCNGVLFGDKDTLITVKDTSTFTYEGTKFKAQILAQNSSVVNIDADELWTGTGTGLHTIEASGTASITVKINTTHRGFNQASNLEINAWTEKLVLVWLEGDNTFTLNGKLRGEITVDGYNNTVLIKDVTADTGACRIVSGGGAHINTNVITIDNSHLIYDFDDVAIGLHNIEDTMGCVYKLINGTILEFSGYHGHAHTYGQPIASSNGGTVYMRNSQVIQHCDQIDGYAIAISSNGPVDIEDSVITCDDWDGNDAHECLIVSLYQSHINCRLKNVTFNNDTGTLGYAVYVYLAGKTLDSSDYICASGLINNTLATNISNDMTSYNTLLNHCTP